MDHAQSYTSALPDGIRSRFVDGINGLRMHVLEAGDPSPQRPCVLLLHGFPELAYSWRKTMLPLAEAGYHVIAPDQRGYGLTSGWDPDYDGDLASYRLLNLVRDSLGLVHALGHRQVAAVVGHDFGASVAAWCALVRPDVFRSMVLMSAPFAGPPGIPLRGPSAEPPEARSGQDIHIALAGLARPRKHYQWYYSTREANGQMWHCAQGVHDFLRAYFHYKSADWPGNRPFVLEDWSATELAKMPTYYIMDLDADMAQTVAPYMPDAAQVRDCRWLSEPELQVYAAAYMANGFQGGLQWYRCRTSGSFNAELEVFSGRGIEVPACFIGGASDWGVRQSPGAYERMQREVCSRMTTCALVDGAGHWVQQEQPDEVNRLLLAFLASAGDA
ncbi:MAG: alpha/beta hydrolase [Gammaproteobacteria bacterium]|nr:alpha/beta hydrolase [Gammaproteobacteria bacterium]